MRLHKSSAVGRRSFLAQSVYAVAGACVAGAIVESPLLASTAAETSPALTANIAVDVARVRHPINPNIYGSFLEHIGRIIYGGIYEEGSKLSDENGFRKDVMDATRNWGVTTLRWPGGNFASGYHWQDGIGPKKNRKRRYDMAWFAEDSNHFGTDEFIQYCRKVGAEPHICVNLGTGTIEEAANWVEYCNGSGDTYFANLRRENGHPKPYGVRYWSLGNEVWGEWQIGYMSAEDYAKIALECAKVMKWVDPSIQLIACGFPMAGWNRIVLSKLIHVADYISLHDYEGSDDYYDLLGSTKKVERMIQLTLDAIDETDMLRNQPTMLFGSIPPSRNKKPIEIAFDEWNIMYRKNDSFWNREGKPPVEEVYNLRDALWVASVLNLFQRMGDKVTMANIAQLVNSIGTMFTDQKGMFLQTIYFPMMLYRRECGGLALRSDVESPTYSSKSFGDVPYLDVSASIDEPRKTVSVAVVNRHASATVETALAIQNARPAREAIVFEINAASPDAENSFAHPENVKINQKPVTVAGEKFSYTFPAHSVTLLKMRIS